MNPTSYVQVTTRLDPCASCAWKQWPIAPRLLVVLTLAGGIVPSTGRAADLYINNPATSSGYLVTSYAAPQLHYPDIAVFGVYETRSDHSANYHPQGTANVHVRYSNTRPMTPLVLVLSSYEPTRWILDAQAGTRIAEILLNGLHAQEVVNVGSIPVVNKSGSGNYFSACAYQWPSDNQGCNTPALVQGVESLVGTPITAFAGVYRATDFTVVGVPVPEPTSMASSLFALGCIVLARRRMAVIRTER